MAGRGGLIRLGFSDFGPIRSVEGWSLEGIRPDLVLALLPESDRLVVSGIGRILEMGFSGAGFLSSPDTAAVRPRVLVGESPSEHGGGASFFG